MGLQGGQVNAFATFDDGAGPALYAGGEFVLAGTLEVNHIARWDGTTWSALTGPMGTGVSSPTQETAVRALTPFDDGTGPALFVGGNFRNAGGVEARGIARWDGTSWGALPGPGPAGAHALQVHDDGSGPALFAGGNFSTVGDLEVNNIAKWDGIVWSGLSGPGGTGVGHGLSNSVKVLTVYDDGSGPALYVGGWFDTAGGVEANDIARWDGDGWSALISPGGNGVDSGSVHALEVHDDGSGTALFVGGSFDTAGGVEVNSIARWDGSSWSPLSGPAGAGMPGYTYVYALEVYNDGPAPALYAGGSFETAGGVQASNIARWDGTSWSALSGPSGTGIPASSFEVSALRVHDDGSGPALWVGGIFSKAGGLPSHHVAVWRCEPGLVFRDGFESGDTSAWATTRP